MIILENKHMNKPDALKYAAKKGVELTMEELETALTTPSRNAFTIPGKPDSCLRFLPLKNRVQVETFRLF